MEPHSPRRPQTRLINARLAVKEETVGAPSSEPSSEPTWVYEPYVGGTEGAERTEPVGVRAKIRAVVLSNALRWYLSGRTVGNCPRWGLKWSVFWLRIGECTQT